jgi:adenosylmethionine-8-amino-7-oxononanoate aminotransferase
MAAIEIVRNKETKEPMGYPMQGTHRIEELMWEKGIYARAMFENIAIAPPLTMKKEDIDLIIDALDAPIIQIEKEML